MEAALKALKRIRKSKDLTQKQLGALLNVAPSTIAMWENGDREPKCRDLKRLATILEVSVDTLLSHAVVEQRSELSEEEKNFLRGFNKLSNDNKKMILNMIGAFLTQQAASLFGSVINNNNGSGNFFANNGNNVVLA